MSQPAHLPGDLTIPLIKNVSGDEHCRFCCSHPGMVVAQTRRDAKLKLRLVTQDGVRKQRIVNTGEHTEPVDEMGPCPACELGNQLEFPEDSERGGPWGREGFWRGRASTVLSTLTVTCGCDDEITPRPKALDYLAAISLRFVPDDEKPPPKPPPPKPPPVIEPPDPEDVGSLL